MIPSCKGGHDECHKEAVALFGHWDRFGDWLRTKQQFGFRNEVNNDPSIHTWCRQEAVSPQTDGIVPKPNDLLNEFLEGLSDKRIRLACSKLVKLGCHEAPFSRTSGSSCLTNSDLPMPGAPAPGPWPAPGLAPPIPGAPPLL
jgi:hypothetical protein